MQHLHTLHTPCLNNWNTSAIFTIPSQQQDNSMAHRAEKKTCYMVPDPHLKSEVTWDLEIFCLPPFALKNLATWSILVGPWGGFLMLHNKILLAAQQIPGRAVEPWHPACGPKLNWLQINQVLMQTREFETIPCWHFCLFNRQLLFKSGSKVEKWCGTEPPASVCIKHFTFYRMAVLLLWAWFKIKVEDIYCKVIC